MHLSTLRIANYRRLKDVRIDLDPETTIFVGANNSGKTSAMQLLQTLLGTSREKFSIHDFSADCWPLFNHIGEDTASDETLIPRICLDLWFTVQEADLHRVVSLLPSLDWKDAPIGVRLDFAPKDTAELLTRFRKEKTHASKFAKPAGDNTSDFHPWPTSLTDYLTRKLTTEYTTFYYALDRSGFDEAFRQLPDYHPSAIETSDQSGPKLLSSLLRVDFLTAQRHLSDSDARGRAEDLSRRLNRFYERNLEKHDPDYDAVAALVNAESELNTHFSKVFAEPLARLNKLGYPGFADPHLVIKSAFDPESLLVANASVHYSLCDPTDAESSKKYLTLPDKYNGLGFKNLIYMVVELLDFHQRWEDEKESRPLLHLVVIEEPEAHLHAQLQQVFIRKVRDLLPAQNPDFVSQLVITTHSPHILYESNFTPIRYFRRSSSKDGVGISQVLNLSDFYSKEVEYRHFLLRYMKATHCDLFFADSAVIVEGIVERLLLPIMIDRVAPKLQSQYLSIIELGGAFAHRFKTLLLFLGLPALVITDLDSVTPPEQKPSQTASSGDSATARDSSQSSSVADEESDSDENKDKSDGGSSCISTVPNAITSNHTLRKWIPRLTAVSELLALPHTSKVEPRVPDGASQIRVAYQNAQIATWNGSMMSIAGRTFEEAFAIQNLEWCQHIDRRRLGLRVITKKDASPIIEHLVEGIHKRVDSSGFDKTKFALELLMMADDHSWIVPAYIREGLQWLEEALCPCIPSIPAAAPPLVVATVAEAKE